jgi:hypothetical protein
VLPQCRTLSVLSLAYNQIGAEGAARLAGVLPQCPKLTNLLLGANQMGAEGAARSRHSQSLSHFFSETASKEASLLPPKPCLRGSFTFVPQTCNGLARKQGHGLHQRHFCITTHDARLRCTCCCMLKRRVIAPVQLHNVGLLLLLSLAGLSNTSCIGGRGRWTFKGLNSLHGTNRHPCKVGASFTRTRSGSAVQAVACNDYFSASLKALPHMLQEKIWRRSPEAQARFLP